MESLDKRNISLITISLCALRNARPDVQYLSHTPVAALCTLLRDQCARRGAEFHMLSEISASAIRCLL
jgi:hypothetical protein